jgi:sulfur carrier protein ThiS
MNLPEKITVRNIIERLGISEQEAAIIFINGCGAKFDHPLSDGDRLSIFPAVGGG